MKLIDLIKKNVPKAADRDPMAVLDEVLNECAKALQAKYSQPAAEPKPIKTVFEKMGLG